MICKTGTLLCRNWVCKKSYRASSDSTMAQILWWTTAFFIGINYNAQNRLLYGALWLYVLHCPHVLKRQNLTHLMRVPGNSMSAESPPILCCLGHRMTWHCPFSIPSSLFTDTQKRVAILTFYNTNSTASGEGISWTWLLMGIPEMTVACL